MRVLVVGSGGREHALAWRLGRCPSVRELAVAPGSAAMARLAKVYPLPLEVAPLVELAGRGRFDLVVVGPEAPLAAGLADALAARGIPVFGCSQAAAQIESSKAFAKALMARAGVPTAQGGTFSDLDQAERFVDEMAAQGRDRLVVKADSLAAGKGVVLCADPQETKRAARRMLAGELVGAAGRRIVVEEHLLGREASCMALADGDRCWPLAPCEDHKAVGDGDEGPMTGGMGAISPTPVVDEALLERVRREVLEPTLRTLAAEGYPFRGLLYAGLMVTRDGPRVLEFNCRLGDPETQALLPRFEGDLAACLLAVAQGQTPETPRFTGAACCLIMAARGYPGSYEKGAPIVGLDEAEALANVMVFHAGTRRVGERWMTSGGRVLGVTGYGATLDNARRLSYQALSRIHFDGAHFRNDIGARPGSLPGPGQGAAR